MGFYLCQANGLTWAKQAKVDTKTSEKAKWFKHHVAIKALYLLHNCSPRF